MVQATVTVPEQSGVCIAFPGIVRNTDRALAMLGGEKAITDAMAQSNPMLRCRLRPEVRLADRPASA
jgi:Tau95 Triple barrel domain